MKRTLLSLALIVAVAAQAQVSNNPAAKVDPKNNKVSNPVVEKPKPKLMTKDELRVCLAMHDDNQKEAEAIKAEQASYKANADKLKAEKADVDAGEQALGKQAEALRAEKDAILKEHADISAGQSKMEPAEFKARNEAYKARAEKFGTLVDGIKAMEDAQKLKRKAFGDKVDALDEQFKKLETRTEAHFDANDKWKAECSNKPYDERDEAAIKKERAAAGK